MGVKHQFPFRRSIETTENSEVMESFVVIKFLLLLAVSLLAVVVQGMDKEEAKNMFRDMAQDCKGQEKASDNDIEVMVNETYPETAEGKCLVACMQEQFGIVRS